MVERFNGRISSEVLNINITSHRALDQLLCSFNAAYNARRQRVLDGKAPDQVVAERLKAKRTLAKAKPNGHAGPCMRNYLMPMADKIMLRKRFVIETVLDTLKSEMGLEHSRHRSVMNAMVHVLSCLVAYAFRPGKPSISLNDKHIEAYP